MTEKKILYKIRVTGRVQGVGFRQSCLKEARFRGIHGYVRNLPDGSVYIEAEGYPGSMDGFLQWCSKGPLFGSVKNLNVEPGELLNYESFVIRY